MKANPQTKEEKKEYDQDFYKGKMKLWENHSEEEQRVVMDKRAKELLREEKDIHSE